MIRSAKYLLKPTKGQARRLDHLLWQQRKLYNDSLEERKSAWKDEQRSISRYDQFASLNGMAETNPELGQYGAHVARGTLIWLDLAYESFYRRCKTGQTPGYPRFKSRARWNSVSWSDIWGWRLDFDSRRFYAKGVGHIRVNLYRELPGRPKTAIVKREGRRWWVIVQCDQVEAKPLPDTNKVVGIDLGVASVLTTSDGQHVANPRHTKRAAAGLADAQRSLARKKKGSANRRKAVARVATHHRKVRNCRHDHAHQLSRWLIDNHDLIVHEKLQITNMVRSAKGTVENPGTNVAAKSGLNRSIHDAGWGQLLAFVTYKAEEAGRHIEAVDPRNTSRTCSNCGHCEKANRQTQAVFRCQLCGFQAHADTNAAVNILRAGLAQRTQREAREKAA